MWHNTKMQVMCLDTHTIKWPAVNFARNSSGSYLCIFGVNSEKTIFSRDSLPEIVKIFQNVNIHECWKTFNKYVYFQDGVTVLWTTTVNIAGMRPKNQFG